MGSQRDHLVMPTRKRKDLPPLAVTFFQGIPTLLVNGKLVEFTAPLPVSTNALGHTTVAFSFNLKGMPVVSYEELQAIGEAEARADTDTIAAVLD